MISRTAALLCTLTALAGAALMARPPIAAAGIAPTVTLDQSGGTAAGSTAATGLDIAFNPSVGDGAKDVTITLPAGLLPDVGVGGGACVASAAANPGCQLGTGTAVVGGAGVPLTMDVVAPPAVSGAAAGIALVEPNGGTLATGALKFETAPSLGFALAFGGLPAVSALDLAFSGLRLPTSCPAPAAAVAVSADSEQVPTPVSASAPLSVTGCSGLPFAPAPFATVTRVGSDFTSDLTIGYTQAAGQSAASVYALRIPSGLTLNRVLGGCLDGTPCSVGTAAISSPVLPASALAGGTLVLGGSLQATTLTMTFPAPYAMSIVGTIDYVHRSIAFTGMPDIPVSQVGLDVTGTATGPAFITTCKGSTVSTTFTPQDGNPAVSETGRITYRQCPTARPAGKPRASGSLTGLSSGHPTLRVRVRHGARAPGVASLTIALPSGVSAVRHALRARHARRALSVTGARLKRVRLTGRRLVIRFRRPADRPSVVLHGGLLAVRPALVARARHHRAGKVTVRLTITDAKGRRTTVRLHL